MFIRIVIALFALNLIAGCKDDGKSNSKASYTYDFTENGCATGAHSASTVPGICAKLEDHVLNRNCAYGMRASQYQSYNCATVLGSKPSLSGGVAEASPGEHEYSYDFTVNGCSTGEQVFDTKEDFCAGLTDEELNDSCAPELRQALFQKMNCR